MMNRKMARGFCCLGIFCSVSLVACVEKSMKLSPTQRAQLQDYVTTQAPAPAHPLRIRYGDALELVGFDHPAGTWQPGQTWEFTWFWHARQPLKPGWRLFTHIVGEGSDFRTNIDGEGIVRALYPPEQWRAGEYIRDVQRIKLPEHWRHPQATLFLGAWREDQRLPITDGPHDGERRGRVVRVPVAMTAAAAALPNSPPRIAARRLQAPLHLDGVLDEPDWQQAAVIRRFVQPLSGKPGTLRAQARVLWDARGLYMAFEVQDSNLQSPDTEHDNHLWQHDCIELLLDADGDGHDYVEVQVSPRGVVFDTHQVAPRQPPPFGRIDWDSRLQAKVRLDGTLDDDRADRGYTLELMLPWQPLPRSGKLPSGATYVAKAGDTWRLNVFVMDGGDGGNPVAWSPPLVGDFHTPDRFGYLVLEESR